MRSAIGFFLLPAVVFGQPAARPPAFDIADVHASPRAEWSKTPAHSMQGGYLSGDRYELHRATMLDLVRTAYAVDADKVYGGPSWLDYDRFEIVAKTRRGTRPETLLSMLQALLAGRFQLAVKMDTREVLGYRLSRGKGELKLRAAAARAISAGCQTLPPTVAGDRLSQNIECRNVSMDSFAASLRGRLQNLPIVNSTGLEGGWDIDLQIPMRTASSDAPPNAGVIDVLDHLGLKLESAKVPQPVLVVESVNQRASANPPGIADSLPPLPPPQFEVASIKWPCAGNANIAMRFETGGRVTATCMPLVTLIRQAWNQPLYVQPVGLPKWLAEDSSTKYNISIAAKAPAGIAPDPQHNLQARDVLNSMLRALLIERYQMKVHFEDRPVDAQTLVAVKPKLTEADPANRTGCTRQNLPLQRSTRLVCHNMTMAQFAEQLQSYEAGIAYPVLDGTGIEGAWDFTLVYDPLASLYERFPQFGRGAAADGQASDPSGSLSFIAAIEKQLGLRLEVQKRPESVLVIDHMEEKPIGN